MREYIMTCIIPILGYLMIAILLFFIYIFIKEFMRLSKSERNRDLNEFINRTIEEAIMAVEEEARRLSIEDRPAGSEKLDYVVGFISRIFQARQIVIPIDILVKKVNAAVYRLFNRNKI